MSQPNRQRSECRDRATQLWFKQLEFDLLQLSAKRVNSTGRAWFQLPSGERVRYDGSNGFLWRSEGNVDHYLSLESIMLGETPIRTR